MDIGGKTTIVEQCHTDIDEDIAALSALHSRKNTLASIFPPEILVTIFTYIVEENIYTDIPRRGGAPTPMIVTHICRHWRQVALECPSLCTFIDCLSAPWVPIMLERSKEAALVVTYVLELCTLPTVVDRVLDCLSSQPAPLLQIFNYTVLGSYDPRISVRPISDTIFQGRAPLLRSVELEECAFLLTSRTLSGLETLDMRQIDSSPHLTLSQLLSALRRMPDLKLLVLWLSSRISEDTELFSKVPFTRLRRISLDGAIQTAVSLFSHIVFPADARIGLYLTEIESPQRFSDLFSAIHKDLDESFPIIRSLCASFHDTVALRFSTSLANIPNSDIRFCIQFEYSGNPAIIFVICRMIPHCKIQNLSIPTSFDLSQNFWRGGSAHLPELESIYLSWTPIADFILALMTAGMSIVYPLLCTLELEHIDFGCDELEDLREIARMRAKCGFGIQKLRLTGCMNVSEVNMQLLEGVIADVVWDRCVWTGRRG
ncbi:hypothetical protein BDR03DRAFT_970603 [Suillus americanus]|nr:hypothetical protein BDR03DRAFT_970603 [Suillus americanus]